MEFLKRWIRSLFGSSLSSKKTTKRIPVRKKTDSRVLIKAQKRRPGFKKIAKRPISPAMKKTVLTRKKRPVPLIKKKPAIKKGQIKTEINVKSELKIGLVTHYFSKVNAAVLKVSNSLLIGDMVRIKTKTHEFVQRVDSMQINRVPIDKAKKNDEIGIQVAQPVSEGDEVYLVKRGGSNG